MTLLEKIKGRQARVGVLGLGYVGLPLAVEKAKAGFRVLGFDIQEDKVARVNRGENYIGDVVDEELTRLVASGHIEASSDFDRLRECDVVAICVPTPLDRYKQPDLSYVTNSGREVAARLHPGMLVVLESTTYPGTTDELVRNMLEQTGLVCGRDFYLAFSPEREDPGNASYSTTTIPKIVGGATPDSGDLAEALYKKAICKVVRVNDARTAEAVKLTENIFRAINIAMVNELKIIYERMNIDVWDVLDAAATKPFGFMRFNPGPGWGGHCIPLDPFYLSWKARECGIETKFIELAGEVNRRMPEYIISKLQQALNERGKSVKGSKLMILGLAYKKDINDDRESPAYRIIARLMALGAKISYHDPFVPKIKRLRQWPEGPELKSQPLTAKNIAAQDAVLVITDHTKVDYKLIAKNAKLIVDSRGVYRKPLSNLVKA